MTTRHTPGPWTISGQLIIGPPEAFPNPKAQPMGRKIAEVYWDWGGDKGATERRTQWFPEADANARLIAAAPELLAALKLFMEQYDIAGDEGRGSRPEIAAARAAIAKATDTN